MANIVIGKFTFKYTPFKQPITDESFVFYMHNNAGEIHSRDEVLTTIYRSPMMILNYKVKTLEMVVTLLSAHPNTPLSFLSNHIDPDIMEEAKREIKRIKLFGGRNA